MTHPTLESDRFTSDPGFRVTVQIPEMYSQQILDGVLKLNPLDYGDYDRVTFQTALGTQQFRSLGSGRNTVTDGVAQVPCIELSFFLPDDQALTTQVIEAIYATHPYEEPVIFVQSCLRSLHRRGMDEDNPNRFWNSKPADWVPQEHR